MAEDFPGPIMELGDKIANLKLTEAVHLKNYLKTKYGLEPAAGGAVMMAAGPAGPAVTEAPRRRPSSPSSWTAWPTPARRST